MLRNWFRGQAKDQDVAHGLYLTAVAQARHPVFYSDHGVPDSVDGRFELIVMHVFLLLRPLNRMSGSGAVTQMTKGAGEIGQALFDTMFGDMDRSLREMGVSDIAVGKRVKYMAKAFYGRAAAYDEALAGSDELLGDALRRNVFGTVVPSRAHVAAMADYLRFQAGHVASIPDAQAISGDMQFAPWPGKGVDP